MRRFFILLPAILIPVLFSPGVYAASPNENEQSASNVDVHEDSIFIFRFKSRTTMFFKHFGDNEQTIRRAAEMIRRNREPIRKGEMYLAIDGYCSSFVTEYSNRAMARNRSNQVKSYFITNHGLKEENYRTHNHTVPYKGNTDVVAMMQLIPARTAPSAPAPDTTRTETPAEHPTVEPETTTAEPSAADTTVVVTMQLVPTQSLDTLSLRPSAADTTAGAVIPPAPAQPLAPGTPETATQTAPSAISRGGEAGRWDAGRWNVKTNLPFWALVVPNIAVEYRFADHWSVDVPIYYMSGTVARNFRFRTLAVEPSVRYWLKPAMKGHFFGVHLLAGQFNVAINKKYRYQDVGGMYGAGIDYGYALKFTERWGMEFNIGAGYIHTRYDTFDNTKNGIRLDRSQKNYFGVTRCGISLIYRIK